MTEAIAIGGDKIPPVETKDLMDGDLVIIGNKEEGYYIVAEFHTIIETTGSAFLSGAIMMSSSKEIGYHGSLIVPEDSRNTFYKCEKIKAWEYVLAINRQYIKKDLTEVVEVLFKIEYGLFP